MKELTFESYQAFTQSLAEYNTNAYVYIPNRLYEDQQDGLQISWLYPALALGEEAGEVLGKIAKFVRKSSDDEAELRELVKKELGDVLYQVSQLAYEFDLSLRDIAEGNVEKLTDRKERGVIVGTGDNR